MICSKIDLGIALYACSTLPLLCKVWIKLRHRRMSIDLSSYLHVSHVIPLPDHGLGTHRGKTHGRAPPNHARHFIRRLSKADKDGCITCTQRMGLQRSYGYARPSAPLIDCFHGESEDCCAGGSDHPCKTRRYIILGVSSDLSVNSLLEGHCPRL